MQNDPRLQQKVREYQAKKDLAFFAGYALGFDNAEHHVEWYDVLQDRLMSDPAGDWDSSLVPAPEGHFNNRIMLMAPRSHAKSTCFTVNYPLWRIGNDPNVRILIVSAALSQSTSFLREIKSTMEKSTNYRKVFGDLFPADMMNAEKWTNTEIIVRRSATHKDPTVAVVGAGGAILSKRADLIICDDILSEENSRTVEQREKIREWFFTTLMPVLEPDGRIIVVGTAWNLEDLYHELMKAPGYKVRKRYQAITDEAKKEVLWQERWSYETLMDLKADSGSVAFNKSYMNIAISDEDAVFKRDWIDAAKTRGMYRSLIPAFDYATWDLGRVTITMGVDLAISKKSGSDFTAFAVVAETKEGLKIPLWLEEDKLSPAETRTRIIELAERYNPEIIIVENNAYQESLRIDLAETTSLPIRGYTTGGEKFDQEIGINSLAVEFENGKWVLPYSKEDGRTIRIVDRLAEGMLQFPSGHTRDILMALWFANTGLRQLKSGKKTGRVKVGKHSLWND